MYKNFSPRLSFSRNCWCQGHPSQTWSALWVLSCTGILPNSPNYSKNSVNFLSFHFSHWKLHFTRKKGVRLCFWCLLHNFQGDKWKFKIIPRSKVDRFTTEWWYFTMDKVIHQCMLLHAADPDARCPIFYKQIARDMYISLIVQMNKIKSMVDDRKAQLMMLLRGNYLITGQQQQNKVSWQKIMLNDLD